MAPTPLTPNTRLSSIRLLTCDVDGVLTDGGIYYDATGPALLRFCVLDGMGIKRLQAAGIVVCFVTQGSNPAVAARAEALGVHHCFLGVEDKLATIGALARELGVALSEVCHIADDVNDLSLLGSVGVAVAVPRAVTDVRAVCHFVTAASGGAGAVRELCEAILSSIRMHPKSLSRPIGS